MSTTAPTIEPLDEEEILRAMQRVSDRFYMEAVRVGCHAFLEFTGLMNEYIKQCRKALETGESFIFHNVHTGEHLPLPRYMEAYIAEKLECIYGRTNFRPHGAP